MGHLSRGERQREENADIWAPSRQVALEEWRSSCKAADAWAPRERWDNAVTRAWKETRTGGRRACQARVGEGGAARAHGYRRRHVFWVVGARLDSARHSVEVFTHGVGKKSVNAQMREGNLRTS
ncbi:hypothetical protein TIFTF001_030473 [Ficus carica]|uniref:Uncharacterized protein n=1 Tax=Ficus carica TaxID=3494 RepID=A0AA88J3U9_FICCA|nr:hypothetical protein TIFTF001_030473 [Ficus carica]